MKPINNILIIGGPNAGKTHFGGQLYGRLQMRNSFYKIVTPPQNLIVFKEVLENLSEGKSAGHTNVSAHEVLELEIEDKDGNRSLFSFPDYGGEQVKNVVQERKINKIWKQQLEKSDAWMLFIRPNEIPFLEDIGNRGLPDQEILDRRRNEVTPMILSTSAFYVELLQMLLYSKKTSLQQITSLPKSTVVLSCWDCIEKEVGSQLPEQVLQQKLSMFHSYIRSTWKEGSLTIIGLSSTEKTLSDKVSDSEYVKKGPENFGYIIDSTGRKDRDLTLSIASLIHNRE